MALASSPALAAAPETPVTNSATSITAHSAILHGTLNPHSSTLVGGYFAYSNPEGKSCAEGNGVALEGFEGEKAEEAIAVHTKVELEPHREYKVCLVATNEVPEYAPGNEITVKTLSPPPEIISESAPPVVASRETTLEATVTANNQVTECHFQYGVTTVTEHEVACTEPSIEGLERNVRSEPIKGLELEKTYKYRVVLKNAKHEERAGPQETFETVDVPTEAETGVAEGITGNGAYLGGKLNAGGQATYYVEFGTAPCTATECGEKTYTLVAKGKTQQSVTPIVVDGLKPLTTYHYWLVAENEAGAVHGPAMEFTTKLAAPSVETGGAEDLTETGAEVTGTVDPGGESEYYVEFGTAACSGTICGARTPAVFVSGKTPSDVAIALSGLTPNTTYHYWLVTKNSAVSEPVQGEARAFTTPKSQSEVEQEAAGARKPEEEHAAAAAANRKAEEEAQAAEAAAATANEVKQQHYNEVAAETVVLERQEAEVTQLEELIDATTVKITKAKASGSGVLVTINVSDAGTVTLTGNGLERKTVKLAAGTHTLVLALTRAGKSARKHRRNTRVTASLETSITTVSGSATVKL
jgi:hypothetical protein